MRIGFEAKRATHNFRGLGNYSRGLIEGLLEYCPADELFLYTPPIKDKRGVEWVNSLSENAVLKYPPTSIEKKFSSIWRSFLLASDLKKDQLDIFHGLSHEIPFRLSERMSFKKVVTIHDLIFLRFPEFFPLVDRLVYKQKFQYACRHSDLVIAICEQTKKDLIQILGVDDKKIAIHYQSCSPQFYAKREDSELMEVKQKYNLTRPYILHVSAFEKNKNQLNLLKAYAQVAPQIEEDLVFVGQGKKYRDSVRALADELKLNQRVHFLDSVRFDQLPCLYQGATLFCYPSLFEGFGIPILEALFSGIPVLTSFGSCFPESAGPNSYFVDPLSVSSISQGIKKVISDKNLQNHMSAKGLEFVQRFHRKNTTAKLADLYRQL